MASCWARARRSTRFVATLSILLGGVLVQGGCPRRFDPRAEEVHSPSSAAEQDYVQARQLLQQGHAGEAEAALQRFTAQHDNDPLVPQATLLRARAALALGEPARARDLVEPLSRPGGAVPQVQERARFLLGLSRYRLGDFAAARALLRPFTDQIVDSEDGTELHAVLADLARRDGQVAEALHEYERFYHGQGVRPVELAYIRQQVRRLGSPLPEAEQRALWPRFDIPVEPAAPPATAGAMRPVIGLLAPLHGKERALGERVLRGALWGADLLDGTLPGAGPGIELRIRDTGAGPGAATAAVDELAGQGVVAIIGPPGRGPEVAAITAEAGQAGLPLLDLSPVSANAEGSRGPLRFSLLRGNAERVRALVQHALGQGARTLAVLAPASAYGQAMVRAATDALAGKGRLLGALTFPEGATTFTEQARQLLALRPQALLLPVSVAQLELIAAQLATSGVIPTQDVQKRPGQAGPPVAIVLATADGMGERLLRNAGRYLQGAVLAPISTGATPSDDPALSGTDEHYQRQFHDEPGALDALGHDAVRLVALACATPGGGPPGPCSAAQVARALPALHLAGATGPVSFDAGGLRGGPPLLVRIEGNGLRVLK